MSRKLPRLLLVASMATGFGLIPMAGADAADTRSVDTYADRFEVPGASNPRQLDILVGDTAAWNIIEGEHTVTPKDKDKWGDKDGSERLTPESDRYTVVFKRPGTYKYYCEIHGDVGANNQLIGMWGEINVTDPNATPPPPPPPSSSSTTTTTAAPTTTTKPPTPQTTAPPASSAGALTPTSAAPAPTTTTPKADKPKKPRKDEEEETTTTTTAPAPPPVDLSAESIVPSLPGSATSSNPEVQDPGDTPEGEAVALLKPKKRGGNGVKLLIASGIGLGALGLGTAGYRFANRSSRYFPA